ncbi:hypothetical protein EG829_32085, partial [bacterium]|nr:hypothetical protein [bacterium]
DEKFFVVTDGKEGKYYTGVGAPVFSPDGRHLAYAARENNRYFIVMDEKEDENRYEIIDLASLEFSPDGKRLAFVARMKKRFAVVIDGKDGRQYEKIIPGSLVFSDDGNHAAYVVQAGKKQFVVVDETEGKHYDSIITGSGGRIIFDGPNELRYLARADKTKIMLVRENIPAKAD